MTEQKISPALVLVGGVGFGLVALVGVYALVRAGIEVVTVSLKNPPSEVTMWSLALLDWDVTVAIDEISGKDWLDITETARFEIPSGVAFPLRVASLQAARRRADGVIIIYYDIQSLDPTEANYRDAFIPSSGDYFYNVATELFEPA